MSLVGSVIWISNYNQVIEAHSADKNKVMLEIYVAKRQWKVFIWPKLNKQNLGM